MALQNRKILYTFDRNEYEQIAIWIKLEYLASYILNDNRFSDQKNTKQQ